MTDSDFDPAEQTRESFPYRIEIPTRWGDNDMLRHINNVAYYRYFEAIVVRFQMEEAGVDWVNDSVSPQAVESLCRFHRPLSFPETIEAGLRVERIGNSSVTFEIALFGERDVTPAATGHFVHVFVDGDSLKSHPISDAQKKIFEKFR
ncbi:MAG: acyl-CoA thioesterase [Nitrospinaceae bacterium]|jgi:acyl-CoA thioester hydrolase|nr:acyl-CoA thioesterase [Alphaproteobacteria bacterium]MBT7857864.1 acyl-CoA thioesterase [Nitrospinaceae bacterium]